MLNPITTATAARILGKSEGTVRQMERRGLLRAIRTDRGVRIFDQVAVERLALQLSGRGTTSSPEAA